jgi:hypothetical protein
VVTDSIGALDRLFPLRAMTTWMLANGVVPIDARTVEALFALNIDKHLEYVERFHPLYFRGVERVAVLWRDRLRWYLTTARP